MSKFSTPPLTYLRLNSKSTFFDHFFSTKVVQMLHLMVFFSYHKSKSPHSSVIFRGLKSYFSQKVRCPNLAHPPLTYLRLNSKSTFFDQFFSTKVVQMLHLMVFFFIINQNPLTVLSSLEIKIVFFSKS